MIKKVKNPGDFCKHLLAFCSSFEPANCNIKVTGIRLDYIC